MPHATPAAAATAAPAGQTHRQNVLNIDTELSVTLAQQSISLQHVLALAPGSRLTFGRHHADPVVLEAAGVPIAQGEVVKIGDRFGIRVVAASAAAPPVSR